MRVALDAMGGDHAPEVVVRAALDIARATDIEVALVGDEAKIAPLLAARGPLPPSLTVHHAPDAVPMGEQPSVALRHRTESSLAVATRLVERGEAAALVSAGNTGAIVAFALIQLGRLPEIDRPALAAPFPTRRGICLVLDAGANADARPAYLLQFARMGAAYAEHVLGIPQPRVGLLNIGEEPGKGNLLARDAYRLLEESGLLFVGNVEGDQLPAGLADVLVTDGFTGNMSIKVAEGTAEALAGELRTALTSRALYRIAAWFLRPAFRSLGRRLDYAEYGGAALLGVRGVVVIAHGRSNERAIRNAVAVAAKAAQVGLTDRIGALHPAKEAVSE